MVPIHDTDIAEERWTQAEWENYELWEKIELRLRRRKQIWIGATVVLFLLLSAVPIVKDRLPKWTASSAARKLAQEINRIKRDANTDHTAYRIRFRGDGAVSYQIEKVANCGQLAGVPVRNGSLVRESKIGMYVMLNAERGRELGVPGLVESFCYDYLSGSEATLKNEAITGFGIMPVMDLAQQDDAGRMDRLSVLLLSGPSAEISFD